MPSAFGPLIRVACPAMASRRLWLASVPAAACRASSNPDEITYAAGTPASRQSAITAGTRAAGTTIRARSTGPGMSFTLA